MKTINDPITGPSPLLRGWLHLVASPVALLAGFGLVIFAPTLSMRVALTIFTISSVTLFTVSATYHRIKWTPYWKAFFRKIDHANIFLIIAGTYTPITIYWLEKSQAQILLLLVWTGSIIGLLARIFWLRAPRWFYVPIYLIIGWAAIFYLPDFVDKAGWLIVGFIIAGGVLYSVGAIIYGLKKPRLSIKYFGFHELFHSFTIAAYICHLVAITLTVTRMY